MATIFERAVSNTGKAYLDAEAELLAAGAAAAPVLNSNLRDPDVIARLISKALLAWIGGRGPRFRAALDYLEYLPQALADTPITNPSPSGIAAYLQRHFGSELVDLLALRLLKEPDWPDWKRNGVLLYLRAYPSAAITEPLIRFVSMTGNAQARDVAVEAIRAAQDNDLQAKLRAEEARLHAQSKQLPNELRALFAKP